MIAMFSDVGTAVEFTLITIVLLVEEGSDIALRLYPMLTPVGAFSGLAMLLFDHQLSDSEPVLQFAPLPL